MRQHGCGQCRKHRRRIFVCYTIIADTAQKCKESAYGKKEGKTATSSNGCHLCQVFFQRPERRQHRAADRRMRTVCKSQQSGFWVADTILWCDNFERWIVQEYCCIYKFQRFQMVPPVETRQRHVSMPTADLNNQLLRANGTYQTTNPR